MEKKIVLITLALAMVLGLAACGSDSSAVPVQRADQLAAAGQAGERYAGKVVSDNVVEIQRDSSKTIEELYVEVGQEVKAGDKLFSYDSDALELDLEKAQLEVEKMTNEQADYAEQLEKLEKQLARTYNESSKVRLTLEINTLKTTIMENDYNLASKGEEIEKLTEMLANIDITTPVDGVVRSINEEDSSSAYITVQQKGAYRVKGLINEMSMGGGLMVGSRVIAYSRVSSESWTGTVASIDVDDPTQNDSNIYYYSSGTSDTMTTTSSYVFYVDLDSTEGLLLGQHVYVELIPTQMPEGLWIPDNYLTDMVMDEETFEMTARVWAVNGSNKLEQRTVTLGEYDYMTGCYQILSGITAEDYLADPANPGCEAGAAVSRREAEDFGYASTGTSGVGETENVVTEFHAEEDYDTMLPVSTAPDGEIPEGLGDEPAASGETAAPTEG